jgi:hypothetical protein
MADAFAALLAEEQGEAPAPAPVEAVGLSEADVDRIATRVAERIARGPMADTVARIVRDVSERLVREEIDKIRASAHTSTTAGGS